MDLGKTSRTLRTCVGKLWSKVTKTFLLTQTCPSYKVLQEPCLKASGWWRNKRLRPISSGHHMLFYIWPSSLWNLWPENALCPQEGMKQEILAVLDALGFRVVDPRISAPRIAVWETLQLRWRKWTEMDRNGSDGEKLMTNLFVRPRFLASYKLSYLLVTHQYQYYPCWFFGLSDLVGLSPAISFRMFLVISCPTFRNSDHFCNLRWYMMIPYNS